LPFTTEAALRLPLTSTAVVVPRKQITLKEQIGFGSFSKVYRVMWQKIPAALKVSCVVRLWSLSLRNKLRFCVQVLRWTAGDPQGPAAESEIAILQTLRHSRVLILVGMCRDLPVTEGTVGLLTELMERGSLYRILHNTSAEAVAQRPTSHATRLRICVDIADGMRFLHESGVLHRDLKSGNVLVDGEGRCKIADFGLSTFRDMTATQTAGVLATLAWTAPEVMTGAAGFSAASDVYSFGVICWEVFSGAVP
jgi:serine/threonine protein kinase